MSNKPTKTDKPNKTELLMAKWDRDAHRGVPEGHGFTCGGPVIRSTRRKIPNKHLRGGRK